MDSSDANPAELTRTFSVFLKRQPRRDSDSAELEDAFIDHQEWREQRRKNQHSAKEYLDATWPDELHELEEKRRELHALAEEFHGRLPPDLQEGVTISPRSFRDISRAVDKVRMRWEKKPEADSFAKARQYLRKVGETINNHSNTLKMLPSSNDYASVFCGALTVFIKASCNYQKVSEEFARAMSEINDAVTTVHEELLQHKDEISMQHLVLRFYCQIFAFLINTMKWYTDKGRKRLLRSLNENLYSQYQEQILEIRRLSEEMHRRSVNKKLTDVISATTLLNERLKFQTELLENDRRSALMQKEGYFEKLGIRIRNEIKQATRDHHDVVQQDIIDRLIPSLVPELSRFLAGTGITSHLENTAAGFAATPGGPGSLQEDAQQPPPTPTTAPTETLPHPAAPTYTRQQILLHSAHLATFFPDQQISPFFPSAPAPTFLASAAVADRLRALTLSPSSAVLHVRGPASLAPSTQTSRLAARYAAASRAAGASVVSYFCSLRGVAAPAGRTPETVALVALAYAVIRQLAELLPEEEEGGGPRFGEFGPERFGALDGTLRTWGEAMGLLGELLAANDEPLLCVVVDGLEVLDDRARGSTTGALGGFVGVLRRRVRVGAGREAGGQIVKLLFTTAGESAALNRVLDGREVVTASATVPVASITGRGFGRKPL